MMVRAPPAYCGGRSVTPKKTTVATAARAGSRVLVTANSVGVIRLRLASDRLKATAVAATATIPSGRRRPGDRQTDAPSTGKPHQHGDGPDAQAPGGRRPGTGVAGQPRRTKQVEGECRRGGNREGDSGLIGA
jgi:hypothetical protein